MHHPGSAGEPAAAWRARWDSLRLFTPVRYDSLPGLAFPGEPDGYPGRDDVVAYLTDYARRFDLPVELDSPVRSVHARDGHLVVELEDRAYEADQVVVATGPFQVPVVPGISERLDPGVVQLHSSDYRNPEALPDGVVLVVGGGNTGFQIAEELARSRQVHLAVGSRQLPLPQRVLGRDLFRALDATGLMRTTVTSRVGRRMKDRETLVGSSPAPRAGAASACARERPMPRARPCSSPTAPRWPSTRSCGRRGSGSTTRSSSCPSSTTPGGSSTSGA